MPTATSTPQGSGAVRERSDDADLVRFYLDDIGTTPLLSAEDEVALAKRIEAGVYASELLRRITAGEDTATTRRRRELVRVADDGTRAKDHMVRANLRLVVSLAKKYSRGELPFLDVVQEGNLGLIHAVEKFDYAKGFKFSTYATWWIRQAIDRGLAMQSRTIRLPTHAVGELSRFSRVERKLALQLGRAPTIEELAAETGTAENRIEELRLAAREAVSLDTPLGVEGDTTMGELIQDADGPTAADIVEQHALTDELRTLLDTLAPREATIVALRFGLHDGHQRTLKEVAERIGLTRERVRQLEKQAIAQLQDPARHRRLLDWAA